MIIVVDGANVMGSRPDGWWRDRAGAGARLYGDLVRVAAMPVAGSVAGYVLVLEGAARRAAVPVLSSADAVAIGPGSVGALLADGSGDDAIVAVVAAVRRLDGECTVVTADRELRRRCAALGATVAGPGWLLARFRGRLGSAGAQVPRALRFRVAG